MICGQKKNSYYSNRFSFLKISEWSFAKESFEGCRIVISGRIVKTKIYIFQQ